MTKLFDKLDASGCSQEIYLDGAPLMPCDAMDGYNLERLGRDRYCLALAVPGFDGGEIDVSTTGGYLRITGSSRLADSAGDVLHRGLAHRLDRTFLMTHPLDVIVVEVRCGLLRIFLREQPSAGVRAAIPPQIHSVDALALAA